MHRTTSPHCTPRQAATRTFALSPRPAEIDRRPIAAIFLVVCTGLAMTAGGCTGGSSAQNMLATIPNSAEFKRQVIQSEGAVLVNFYKDGCPACAIQEPILEKLSAEYSGQVRFAKFDIHSGAPAGMSSELTRRYGVSMVPTVVLFIDGQEKQRWVAVHGADDFRGALATAVAGKHDNSRTSAAVAPKPGAAAGPISGKPSSVLLRPADTCIEGQGCPAITEN